jgi:hypothetical protein
LEYGQSGTKIGARAAAYTRQVDCLARFAFCLPQNVLGRRDRKSFSLSPNKIVKMLEDASADLQDKLKPLGRASE